jgi:hypothetical protein
LVTATWRPRAYLSPPTDPCPERGRPGNSTSWRPTTMRRPARPWPTSSRACRRRGDTLVARQAADSRWHRRARKRDRHDDRAAWCEKTTGEPWKHVDSHQWLGPERPRQWVLVASA